MYIYPNTIIRLINGCPLDTSYEHTIYFSSTGEQYNYFANLTKYSLDNNTYQRVQRGKMRVQLCADKIYDCNYLMFQNSNYGSKWFYAFITGVEYINNSTAEISFIIDVMQTWMFNYTLCESFVEREHSETDGIGQNTIPEDLELGEYITTAEVNYLNNQWYYDILMTKDPYPNGEIAAHSPQLLGGLPMPCYMKRCTTITEMQDYITQLDSLIGQDINSIVAGIFATPANFASSSSGIRNIVFNAPERKVNYEARNKKLLCYPFVCLTLTGDSGSAEFRYELFKNQTPSFNIACGYGQNAAAICTASNYAGYNSDMPDSVSVKGWPILAWVNNAYQNWLTTNAPIIAAGILGGAAMLGMGVAPIMAGFGTYLASASGVVAAGTAAGVKTAIAGAAMVGSTLKQMYQHSTAPGQMHGLASAGDTLAGGGLKGFRSYCRSIRAEYARIADDYFDKFGYATHRLKVPNTHSRPHWNYVKTINATITGSVPSDDMNTIIAIYDKGITFWKDGSEIGNYSLDNTVGGNPEPAPPASTITAQNAGTGGGNYPDDPITPVDPVVEDEYNITNNWCPINGGFTISAYYHETIVDGNGNTVVHQGTDLACSSGTPIFATQGGVVQVSGWSTEGYGFRCRIKSGEYNTLYAHMCNAPVVTDGATVSKGQLIGYVGATGNATGPHLHVEVWHGDTYQYRVDPADYIPCLK